MTTSESPSGSKKEETRRRIVAAARRIFIRHPYHKASLRMIAAEGDFHFSLINHYFSKSELFGAVAAEVGEELLSAYQSWMADTGRMSPESGLSLFLDRALAYLFEKPDVLMILMKNAGEAGTGEGAPAFDYFSGYVFSAGAELLQGLPARADQDHVLRWFYGILNMLINYVGAAAYHGQVLNMDPDSEQYRLWVKDSLLYLFLPGLKTMVGRTPVISVVGKKKSGKTILVEQLVSCLKQRGYRVGTIKHAPHGFTLDTDSGDSGRHLRAGADTGMVVAPDMMVMTKRPLTNAFDDFPDWALPCFDDLDLVITEGYKTGSRPKIEIFRPQRHEGLCCLDDDHLFALVTDAEIKTAVKRFGFDETDRLADLIEERFLRGA